jgi:hypothetical protein
MQEDYGKEGRVVVDGQGRVVVARELVEWIRRAGYVEIGTVAEDLDVAVSRKGREGHPEWFRGAGERLQELCGLLERLGWAQAACPDAVAIDLSECGGMLVAVCGEAVELAEVEQALERVGQLRELRRTVRGGVARLTRGRASE